MHRIRILLIVLPLVVASFMPARAATCADDQKPAATLLLPYFEVNPFAVSRVNTVMTITNADIQPVIAQVVIWSEFSIPVLVFQVYLVSHDLQRINLRNVINGQLPPTFPNTVLFPSCPPTLPAINPTLPPLVPYLRDALTGQPVVLTGSPVPRVFGLNRGDRIARGYVTVDVVNVCTLVFPGDLGFFIAGGGGVGSNRNVLFGDYFYVSPSQGRAEGFKLAALEADDTLGAADYTFWYRFSGGADNREPLGSTHAIRYVVSPLSPPTEIFYWRDPKREVNPLAVGTTPAWYPLDETEIVAFDEQDNVAVAAGVNPFPLAAGKAVVGTDVPTPFAAGWIYLNLNVNVAGSTVPFEPLAQSTVAYTLPVSGGLTVGMEGTTFTTACDPPAAPIPLP